MNDGKVQTIKEPQNIEPAKSINKIAEMPIEEKEVNTYYEELTIGSEVIYLRKKKIRRRKAGGIF